MDILNPRDLLGMYIHHAQERLGRALLEGAFGDLDQDRIVALRAHLDECRQALLNLGALEIGEQRLMAQNLGVSFTWRQMSWPTLCKTFDRWALGDHGLPFWIWPEPHEGFVPRLAMPEEFFRHMQACTLLMPKEVCAALDLPKGSTYREAADGIMRAQGME